MQLFMYPLWLAPFSSLTVKTLVPPTREEEEWRSPLQFSQELCGRKTLFLRSSSQGWACAASSAFFIPSFGFKDRRKHMNKTNTLWFSFLSCWDRTYAPNCLLPNYLCRALLPSSLYYASDFHSARYYGTQYTNSLEDNGILCNKRNSQNYRSGNK